MLSAAVAATLAGCGLSNPDTPYGGLKSSGSTSTQQASTTQNAEPTHERHGKIPAAASSSQNTLSAGAGGSTPDAAIKQYAALWCNWTSGNLLAHEHRLEGISVGGARQQESLAIASPTETGSKITSTCKVVAIAAGTGPAAGSWVLVTSSQTVAPGQASLPAQLHVTYAGAVQRSGRWVINQWSPQI